MGKLINSKEFGTKYESSFYFPPPEHIPYHANGSGGLEAIEVTIEREFKYIALIQREQLESIDPRFWIDLRKLTERQMSGDVIYWYKSLDYKWCWNRDSAKGEYDRKYDTVRHGYWHFDFEFDADRTVFALHFGELMSEAEEEELGGMMKAPKGEYAYGGW